MGIQGLWNWLDSSKRGKITDYLSHDRGQLRGKKIAVDFQLYWFKTKEGWKVEKEDQTCFCDAALLGLWEMLKNLRKAQPHLVFVFEGLLPEEKKVAWEKRHAVQVQPKEENSKRRKTELINQQVAQRVTNSSDLSALQEEVEAEMIAKEQIAAEKKQKWATLVEMGFEKNIALSVLKSHKYNLESAVMELSIISNTPEEIPATIPFEARVLLPEAEPAEGSTAKPSVMAQLLGLFFQFWLFFCLFFFLTSLSVAKNLVLFGEKRK
jgi:hypothetical protein